MNNISLYIYSPYFIYSPVDGHLDFFFYFLALINSANMKTSIYTYASVQILLLILLDNISRNGIAGSYGDSVFNILKNCQTHWLL